MSSAPLRILLVEDDELFRLGLQVRLEQEPELIIAAEAEDGEAAIALVSQVQIDLVLLDVGLPGIGGIEACRQIKQRCPDLPILVLTSHAQPSLINRLIEAGAQGYCLKGIASEKLLLAIRSVTAGASWWDSAATKAIQTAFQPLQDIAVKQDSSSPLTQREQEILALLATGKTNPEIAADLYITPGTVRVHVHAILHKLQVSDRAQAIAVAVQRHLIAPPRI
ncbi:MAG: response regulator transcription factor [Thermosynechococcaceae cyanobacterium MS004]|nr:response regulator transcription factor [Thermosynechococcaceae cyanobacterium MS004]